MKVKYDFSFLAKCCSKDYGLEMLHSLLGRATYIGFWVLELWKIRGYVHFHLFLWGKIMGRILRLDFSKMCLWLKVDRHGAWMAKRISLGIGQLSRDLNKPFVQELTDWNQGISQLYPHLDTTRERSTSTLPQVGIIQFLVFVVLVPLFSLWLPETAVNS